MARKFSITSTKPLSEINLTPLMDLTFVLLITFIITFPLIEQGIPIRLPKAETEALPEQQSQAVSIDREGQVFVNDVAMSFEELEAELRRLHDLDPESSVLVRADEELQYREVVKILKALHAAEITRMSLVTQASE